VTSVNLTSAFPDPVACSKLRKPLDQTNSADAGTGAAQPDDQVQLSPAALREAILGAHIKRNEHAGKLTADQAQQLSAQLDTIQQDIDSGSDPATINQLQNQLRLQIYQNANPGATPA